MAYEDLDAEGLKCLRKQWWEEAVNQGKPGRLLEIARRFGAIVDTRYTKYSFKNELLEIFYDAYGNYAWAKYDGRKFYSSSKSDELYVPGPWDAICDSYYQQVLELVSEEVEKKRKKEIADLRALLLLDDKKDEAVNAEDQPALPQ